MIKTNQTIVCNDYGNCMQAVLSSLFEIDMDKTINPLDHGLEWNCKLKEWLLSIGYRYEGVMNACSSVEQNKMDLAFSDYSVGGFFYGVVPSKTFEDETHAIIINCEGIVVHDPNPNKAWLNINVLDTKDLIYWYQFEKI